MTETGTADRAAILAKRRELRKAKKVKGREFKEIKKKDRAEKKQQIQAKIRAKHEAEKLKAQGKTNENGCWLCGQDDHRKQDCPNKSAGDLSKTCFKCRRRGHTSQNCPSNSHYGPGGFASNPLTEGSNNQQYNQQQQLVCFNCGESSHSLRDCRAPRVNGGATYATCFVCSQTGHLSSQCPQSTTGIYPKGGCCKVCKSINHLARDCPVAKISVDSNGASAHKPNKKKTFGDDDELEVDTGGDALDSYDLGQDDDDDEDNKKKEEKEDGSYRWGQSDKKQQPPQKKARTVKF